MIDYKPGNKNISFKNQIKQIVHSGKFDWDQLTNREKINLLMSYLVEEDKTDSIPVLLTRIKLLNILYVSDDIEKVRVIILSALEKIYFETINSILSTAYEYEMITPPLQKDIFEENYNDLSQQFKLDLLNDL